MPRRVRQFRQHCSSRLPPVPVSRPAKPTITSVAREGSRSGQCTFRQMEPPFAAYRSMRVTAEIGIGFAPSKLVATWLPGRIAKRGHGFWLAGKLSPRLWCAGHRETRAIADLR